MKAPDFTQNYFGIFGLTPRYHIDFDVLQNRFYELSLKWHPDRFHSKSQDELIKATERFAELNKALSTLKSDLSRSEYLFTLADFRSISAKNALPPDLAEEYFILQETLEDGTPEARKNEFEKFSNLVRQKLGDSDFRRAEVFKQWEATGAPLNKNAHPFFEEISALLHQRSYLSSMLADMERKCLT